MLVPVAAVAGFVMGLLGGLLTARARGRWCPGCGRTLDCIVCMGVNGGAPRTVPHS